MKEVFLELFLTIHGIGAASGIINYNNELKIIADDSNFLYSYHLDKKDIQKTLLRNSGINEYIPKNDKPDFESIVEINDTLYIFGSGSSTDRNQLIKYNPNKEILEEVDLSSIYKEMKDKFDIAQPDFNIEGAVSIANDILLFNRGNGPAQKNGIFKLHSKTLHPYSFTPVELPCIDGVSTGFTDAVYTDDKIYFIAAAEDIASTYLDGEVKGSIIGCLNTHTLSLDFTKLLSKKHKFEGITVFKKAHSEITFILCEDNDDNNKNANLYKLKLTL